MTAKEAVKAFLEKLVEVEVTKVLPAVAHFIPGVSGQMAATFLSLPEVQAKLKQAEDVAVDKAVDFLAVELDHLKAWVLAHVHSPALHKAVQDVYNVSVPGAVSLDADAVRLLAVLAASGDLHGALRQAVHDLVPSFPA